MAALPEAIFTAEEQIILDEIGCQLRDEGMAGHVTVNNLLECWQDIASTFDIEGRMVEEYANDLTARDALEVVLDECKGPLRDKLERYIDDADRKFLQTTRQDTRDVMRLSIQIGEGWWWKRIPAVGWFRDRLAKVEADLE